MATSADHVIYMRCAEIEQGMREAAHEAFAEERHDPMFNMNRISERAKEALRRELQPHGVIHLRTSSPAVRSILLEFITTYIKLFQEFLDDLTRGKFDPDDFIDLWMADEKLEWEELRAGFQQLVYSGKAWSSYPEVARTAMSMIDGGMIQPGFSGR